MAFDNDRSISDLVPPTPSQALGKACHSLFQKMGQGYFDNTAEDKISGLLSSLWDELIIGSYHELQTHWIGSNIPEPDRWPRYQIVKVRFLRFLENENRNRRNVSVLPTSGAFKLENEKWLESLDGKIIGRADRVEILGHRTEIIDLKTNTGNNVGNELKNERNRRQLLIYAYLWRDRNGSWPSHGSIQGLSGERFTFGIDPEEAKNTVAQAMESLSNFNKAVGQTVDPNSLAAPSATSCLYCPYKGGCSSFWSSLSHDWGWSLKCFRGSVQNIDTAHGALAIIIHPENTNLTEPVNLLRLIGVPDNICKTDFNCLAVIGAFETHGQSNYRTAWDTLFWEWD